MRYQLQRQSLDEYVYGQQTAYLDGLYQYDEGLAKAVEGNFRDKEWFFNHQTREWSNERTQVSFRGAPPNSTGTNQGMSPLQYLIDSNRRLLLTGPCQGFEDLQGVSEALLGILSQEHRVSRRDLLK